jgi:hypothetical protein
MFFNTPFLISEEGIGSLNVLRSRFMGLALMACTICSLVTAGCRFLGCAFKANIISQNKLKLLVPPDVAADIAVLGRRMHIVR